MCASPQLSTLMLQPWKQLIVDGSTHLSQVMLSEPARETLFTGRTWGFSENKGSQHLNPAWSCLESQDEPKYQVHGTKWRMGSRYKAKSQRQGGSHWV